MAIIDELGVQWAAAQAKLEALGPDASSCRTAGLKKEFVKGISDAIANASNLDFQLHDKKEKAKDAEGFKVLFEKFKAQVEAAEDAVQKGKEELARLERERAARAETSEKIGTAITDMHHCLDAESKGVVMIE